MSKIKVRTFQTTIRSYNQLTVEVGTNCPMGGDSGHGGRTYLRINNDLCTNWRVRLVDERSRTYTVDQPCLLEIILGGDAEHRTLLQALRFAVTVLEDKLSEKGEWDDPISSKNRLIR